MASFSTVLMFLQILSLPLAINANAGVFGAYPLHGGNHMKQQIALDSTINTDNIDSLSKLCEYSDDGEFGYIGYPLVDDARNVYTQLEGEQRATG